MEVLGIDFGGSGIKGAIVDAETGALLTDRHRIVTPQPATPEMVAVNHCSIGSAFCLGRTGRLWFFRHLSIMVWL